MNKKKLTFLFLLLHIFFTFSQEVSLDSLRNKSFEELSEKFHEYYDLDNYDSIGNIYATAYLIKAKEKNKIIEIANSYRYKSIFSDHDTAIKYCDSIIRLTENNQSFNYPALGYMMKGYFLYNYGKEKESITFYLKASEYAIKQKNLVLQVEIKDVIATNELNYGNYESALKTLKEIEFLIKHLPNHKKYTYTDIELYDNLTKAHIRARKLDSASYFNQKGLELSLQKKDVEYYHNFLLNSGVINYFKNNYTQALDSINKVEPFEIDDGLAVCYYYKGKIVQKTDIEKTVTYFNKIDSIYSLTENPHIEWSDVYKTLADYHGSKKNHDKQLENIYKLVAVDSVLHSNSIYIDKQIKEQYEIPQLKRETKQLEQLILEKKKKNRFAIVALCLSTLLSICIAINYFIKQKKYKKRFDEFILKQESKTKPVTEINTVSKSKGKLPASEKVVNDILKNIEVFEHKKEFLNHQISLTDASKKFNTNTAYLSKIINHYKHKTFSSYINDLRLNYCIEKLKTEQTFRQYTIDAIAHEIGFNKAQPFSKAFYKKTGVYPSFFIRQLNKKVS